MAPGSHIAPSLTHTHTSSITLCVYIGGQIHQQIEKLPFFSHWICVVSVRNYFVGPKKISCFTAAARQLRRTSKARISQRDTTRMCIAALSSRLQPTTASSNENNEQTKQPRWCVVFFVGLSFELWQSRTKLKRNKNEVVSGEQVWVSVGVCEWDQRTTTLMANLSVWLWLQKDHNTRWSMFERMN